MTYGYPSVSTTIKLIGVDVVINSLPTATGEFDANTEAPIPQTPTEIPTRAQIKTPTDIEIKNAAGLIDINSKRFVFDKSYTPKLKDNITYLSVTWEIVAIRILPDRNIAFGNTDPI